MAVTHHDQEGSRAAHTAQGSTAKAGGPAAVASLGAWTRARLKVDWFGWQPTGITR
eukprot:CAMPEP_0202884076 /NCGR_PEP_ID=MMETSP1391-20130828/40398_1 /ASSEMBLY_ACC=CAM_ASM_000867 /TAXON_ID=1034604 /ORGANISM="Chlamydomonas leiostraca, Strain SAG 11-49" /LENGTH=55 /DNA_ID=CAMNT_0049567197 /DNA_START=36 /DNA_END=200 /DNA_ORIENTATION=+